MSLQLLKPISIDFENFINSLPEQALGRKTVFHTQTDFPKLIKRSIAIISVFENRGANKINQDFDIYSIRKELYKLFPGNWSANIIDLGNLPLGSELSDTHFLLKSITEALIKLEITLVVIGGTQDLTYPLYRAFDQLDQMVNLVAIDKTFKFEKQNSSFSDKYLSKIIVDQPNNLFNYSNVGYQTYFNSQEEIDLIEKLFFDAYRLGEISNNITLAEPIFRDADIVSIDLTSIMSSYSGNFTTFAPNGFSGKEICALSRYAGISDKVSVLGVFNQDYSANETLLSAQIIWYFIEGFSIRSYEYPFVSKENYIKYTVTLADEIVFYKSNISERWWIEIENIYTQSNNNKKKTLLPCSEQDYLDACAGEIPERWFKAQRKYLI